MNIFRIELKRAFTNIRFYIALLVGMLIITLHLIDIIPEMINSYECDGEFVKTTFYVWIGAGTYKWHTYLYFLIFPLIATLPYGISTFTDRKNCVDKVVEYSAREDKNFEECVVLDVKINIKNNSESDQECDFTEIMLDYNDNCKNVSMDAFYQMSQQEAGLCTITPPGDEFDVVLPFLINKGQLNNGSTVDFNKAQLVFSLYPTKKYMNLHT